MAQRTALPRWQSYLLLLINTVVWGASLVIVKPAFETTTPFRYLWYRFLMASLLSIPIFVYYWPKLKNKMKTLLVVSAIEFLGTVISLGLLYVGLSRSTAIETSLLATTAPVFVTLAGIIFLKEKEEANEWLGLGVALLGTIMLTLIPYWGTPIHTWFNIHSGGTVLMLLYTIVNAFYFILAKKYFQKLPKLFTSAISFVFGAGMFGILSWFELGPQASTLVSLMKVELMVPSVFIACTYMAIFGSIIGLTAYIKGQDGIEASEASLFGYLQPFVYLPLGILILKESVSGLQLLALGIVISGVILAEMRSKARRKRRAHHHQ